MPKISNALLYVFGSGGFLAKPMRYVLTTDQRHPRTKHNTCHYKRERVTNKEWSIKVHSWKKHLHQLYKKKSRTKYVHTSLRGYVVRSLKSSEWKPLEATKLRRTFRVLAAKNLRCSTSPPGTRILIWLTGSEQSASGSSGRSSASDLQIAYINISINNESRPKISARLTNSLYINHKLIMIEGFKSQPVTYY